jgi:hypothetical protein
VSLGEPVGGVDKPGVNVLTHRGKNDPKEPPIPASGFGPQQIKVVLFAFDGAFGTRTGITMALPQDAVSRDEGMKPIIVLGIGIDDPTVGGAGTAIVKKGTRG